MCGITGILTFEGGAQGAPELLRRMCAAMAHRGPDDEGIFARGRVALGMRRLSIVDLNSGHQPISNEDGTVWIVFNGEIYNHTTLRERLIARGHRFSTKSDTEVIVHLYEEYGRDCLQYLEGMFAFAIWDSRQRCLFVARDRFGIKPLYYRLSAASFLFGSEIKVLLAHPEVRPEFDRSVLPEYLAFGYLSGSETFYEGIRKLMPGCWLEINETGELRIEQYWDLRTVAEEGRRTESYVERYRELLDESVRSHLMSDVPVGVFLSGGLDSSAVAALMSRARGSPIETFSVGFSEHAYSELPYARTVAEHLNSIHHEVVVSEDAFFKALPKLVWHEDEPMAWPSSVALYFVARLAQKHVKVVLTGEGSDETLAGYSRYAFTLKNVAGDRISRRLLPPAVLRRMRKFISDSRLIGAQLRRKLSHSFLARDGESWEAFYFDNFFSAFTESEQRELLHSDLTDEFEPGSAYGHVLDYWRLSAGEMLQRLLYTDIKTYLVELLMKQDNMSMAASIESRVPFLDHKLVEFAAQIPAHIQLNGLTGKNVLKKAMDGLLPNSIVYRKKLGFPTPWSGWLRGRRLEDIQTILSEPRARDRRLFKPAAIDRIFAEHRNRHRDHSDRIWRLLNLELWHRACLEYSMDCVSSSASEVN